MFKRTYDSVITVWDDMVDVTFPSEELANKYFKLFSKETLRLDVTTKNTIRIRFKPLYSTKDMVEGLLTLLKAEGLTKFKVEFVRYTEEEPRTSIYTVYDTLEEIEKALNLINW